MVVLCQGSEGSYDKISKQIDALMDELMGPQLTRIVSTDAWEPQWNVYELSEQYMICVELAGIHHEKIDLQVDRGTLRLSGYRGKPELVESDEVPSVHVIEIDWGRFERTLAIPPDVDASGISATYRNGYLWVLLPKRRASQGDPSP
ncbi:MAG: Hsp20/alpha crystallin family protein [Phycisphaerae bacterium]